MFAQLRTARPPEVRTTYDRLRRHGVSAWRVYWLLVLAYEAEVAAMMLEQRVYDHAAYLRRLTELPARPRESLNMVPRRWPA